jgi:outer membrane protein assembly factor BamB
MFLALALLATFLGPVATAFQGAPAATPGATPAPAPVVGDAASDPSRGGRLPGPGPEGDIGVRWIVQAEGEVGTPVAAGEYVLLRSSTVLTAYTVADGDTAWQFDREAAISDPFVSDGIAYITDPTTLVALDIATGQVIRETSLTIGSAGAPADVTAGPLQPAVADGVVYVVSGTFAFAIDAANGEYIWRYDAGDLTAVAVPVVTSSDVIAPAARPGGERSVLVLDRETGLPSGVIPYGGDFIGFTTVDDLLIAWSDTSIVALSAYGGSPVAFFACGPVGSPVIVDGYIFAVCAWDQMLTRLDPATEEMAPLLPASGWNLIGGSGESLFVTSNDETVRTIRAVDVTTGNPRWQMALPPTVEGMVMNTGTVVNGMVILTTATSPETEDEPSGSTLVGVGGTEGPFGRPISLELNPPAPGSFLRIANATNLLAAPSVEGAPIAELAPDAQVLVTGQTEEVNGTTWWQVDDPGSGRTGWVQLDAFETVEE